jgi:hypothetical protein
METGPVRDLVDRVRARWRRLHALRAMARGAIAASALLAAGLVGGRLAGGSPVLPLVLATLSIVGAAALLVWHLTPLRHAPSARRIARFVEERTPGLDDRLATAVDLIESGASGTSSLLARSLMADAAARAEAVDVDRVCPPADMRRAAMLSIGATVLLAGVLFFSMAATRRSLDAATLAIFPARVELRVQPGDMRIAAGSTLSIEARLVGSRATVQGRLEIDEGPSARSIDMASAGPAVFRATLDAVNAPFRYRVRAGAAVSASYAVTVTRPPRVARVDLDYTYPRALGLKPRTEEDGGDIYAPVGTEVRVRIHADRPVAAARLIMGGGSIVTASPTSPSEVSATLRVTGEASYRIALTDQEGLSSPGETEYFVRVLDDRPPDVHITKPASDRRVTRLEEVEIEARADDDHGVDRLELVYAVRGEAERAVPLDIVPHSTSVVARHTLFLEDLDVAPGDFVSYYVRGWDRTSGTRPRESRSDIFFLDVRPYEQEFTLAMSQSMSGAGYAGALDELVNRQRQVIVATWKLNRRAADAGGAQSDRDIRSVAETEAAVRSAVEQTGSTFRETTMRDPRRRDPGASARPARPEEDAMAAAALAISRAVASLEASKTGDALPPEMEALNHLLKAQADIKRRQLAQNQSASAADVNTNRNYDVSTLFDRELQQRQQQTSYETSKAVEQPAAEARTPLDAIGDLARRQDELLRRQQAIGRLNDRAAASVEERKRELEQLTRDQAALRQQVEDVMRRLASPQNDAAMPARGTQTQRRDDPDGAGSAGHAAETSRDTLRDVSDAMQRSTSDLRRGASAQAEENAVRALSALRDLERRLRTLPADRLRALGDMRLEARQIADAQRQIASQLDKLPPREAGEDGLRRLAAEQARLADRTRRLEADMKLQRGSAAGIAADSSQPDNLADGAAAIAGLPDRLQRNADDLKRSAPGSSRARASAAEDLARQLDRLADRINASGVSGGDGRKLSEQLARAEELQENLQQFGRALEKAGRENARAADSGGRNNPGESGRTGEGRRGAGGTDLSQLRQSALRQLEAVRKLVEEVQRQDPGASRNGAGFSPEGQGIVLSAPGTESFKQDFEKWELLRRQALAALDQTKSTLEKRTQAADARHRLAAGVDETAPPDYRGEVEEYFKALASPRR